MNPLIVRQTKEEIALAAEVNRNANLTSVRLARAKLESQPLEEVFRSAIAVQLSFRARHIVDAPEDTLRVEVHYQMSGSAEKKDSRGGSSRRGSKTGQDKPVVRVDAWYEIDYRLHPGYEPSARAIRAFKDGNVIFNSWPYFREYLQDATQRMGLPGFTAPFFRIEPAPEKGRKNKTPSASPQHSR